MFGYRSDGKKVKNISPFFKLIPHIMKTRNDAQVYYTEDIPITALDEYIDKKADEGIKLSYMSVIYSALVKLISQRPQLNRFIINGITYERTGIYVSLAIKKDLCDEGIETIVKLPFTGNENIFEINNKLSSTIVQNKSNANSNETDKLARILSLTPNWLLKFLVNSIMFLDNRGLLPKSIINASPFHTSAFLTNVASLGIDSIYHHLYNFGTTGIFIAMGKKKKSYIYDDDIIKEEKCISFSIVFDERICDGYYFANSVKLFKKYLKKPELLEN